MGMMVRRGELRMNWDMLTRCSISIRDFTMMLVVERFKDKVEMGRMLESSGVTDRISISLSDNWNVTLQRMGSNLVPEMMTSEQMSEMLLESYSEIQPMVMELEREYAELSLLLLNLQMI